MGMVMLGWIVAAVLGLILSWLMGIRFAQNRGFCAYCHELLGPPPKDLNHWETCPIHPAAREVTRLRSEVAYLTARAGRNQS